MLLDIFHDEYVFLVFISSDETADTDNEGISVKNTRKDRMKETNQFPTQK